MAQLAANNLTITPSNGPSNGFPVAQEANNSIARMKTLSEEVNTAPKMIAPHMIANVSVSTSVNYRRPRQIFSAQQEEQLTVYVRETANYYSGLSSKEVRILAFVYGVCNHVEMPTGWHETHQASFDWCVGFIKRNKLSALIINSVINRVSSTHSTNSAKTTKVQSEYQNSCGRGDEFE